MNISHSKLESFIDIENGFVLGIFRYSMEDHWRGGIVRAAGYTPCSYCFFSAETCDPGIEGL